MSVTSSFITLMSQSVFLLCFMEYEVLNGIMDMTFLAVEDDNAVLTAVERWMVFIVINTEGVN